MKSTLLPLSQKKLKLAQCSVTALSNLLPLVLKPLISPQKNHFHISISFQLFLSLISIDCESTTSLFFSLLKSDPRFLCIVPLFESFLQRDILTEYTDSLFLRNLKKEAWLNHHLSPQEIIWRKSVAIDSQHILRLILQIIQTLCHQVNTRFQNFFRHQNTSLESLPERPETVRVVEEFDPNNPDSMDFVNLFCDFTFSSSLMFCNKVLGE